MYPKPTPERMAAMDAHNAEIDLAPIYADLSTILYISDGTRAADKVGRLLNYTRTLADELDATRKEVLRLRGVVEEHLATIESLKTVINNAEHRHDPVIPEHGNEYFGKMANYDLLQMECTCGPEIPRGAYAQDCPRHTEAARRMAEAFSNRPPMPKGDPGHTTPRGWGDNGPY